MIGLLCLLTIHSDDTLKENTMFLGSKNFTSSTPKRDFIENENIMNSKFSLIKFFAILNNKNINETS